jgi:hypothetical protein
MALINILDGWFSSLRLWRVMRGGTWYKCRHVQSAAAHWQPKPIRDQGHWKLAAVEYHRRSKAPVSDHRAATH